MADQPSEARKFQRAFLLLFVIAISLLFLSMVRAFLMTVLLAGILAGMFHPTYDGIARRLGGHKSWGAALTVLLFLVVLVIPLSIFFGIVGAQALEVSSSVAPWIEAQLAQPDEIDRWARRLPFAHELAPYKDEILTKLGELAGSVGTFVARLLAQAARGTVVFFFMLFILLYSMFFFLKDGRKLLDKIVYYMPLEAEDEMRMVDKFMSVSRATIKGTLVIGVVQGGLAGLAFAVVGIPGAAFWGTVMAVLSIIPALGTGLVWLPAAIWLAVIGQVGPAVGLTIWCVAVVGTADNFLRPWLVGRDTEMPDLLILLSTLGGLTMFGAIGLVIGPIVAALFVAVWEIYGDTFSDVLPGGAAVETVTEVAIDPKQLD
jgi:predicted PurR-regulated permease PerM